MFSGLIIISCVAYFFKSIAVLHFGIFGIFCLDVGNGVKRLLMRRAYRMRVTDSQIGIQQGIWIHKELVIYRDKIFALNYKQSMVQKWFGLTMIQIRTTGLTYATPVVKSDSMLIEQLGLVYAKK